MDQEYLLPPSMSEETVFGGDQYGEDGGLIMSDRVQAVATNVYREFERMIPAYGEDVVKEMMPHIVTILESLDVAFKENQEKEAELELCKDDNEQLMTQYEREKQLRKSADQKLMAIEDMIDDERKDMSDKIESLQSVVRTFELKTKNAQDHITRFEEKELEMKKEYSVLHDRYTELLKKHMDHVEKSKLLMGADRLFELGGVSPRKDRGLQMPVLRSVGYNLPDSSKDGYEVARDASVNLSHVGRPAKGRTAEKDIITDSIDVKEKASAMTPEELDTDVQRSSHHVPGKWAPAGNMSSIYDELLDSDGLAEVDDGSDITGQIVNPGDFASSAVSDNFFGMSKEVENLILENTELLATKNALNVVKDDLIAKLDELNSEQEIMQEEMESSRLMKEKMKLRIAELEDDIRKLRESHEIERQKISMEDEDELPMAQRKRFTRVEMARVLMERNQYKERLMELQEAVRWTEMIRASREHPDILPGSHAAKKKSSIWNFFSNLFNSSSNRHPKKIASMPTVRYNAPTSQNRSAESSPRKEKQKINERKRTDFLQDEMLTEKKRKEQEQERKEQYKQLRAHVKKEDGRMQAYGWSVPAKCSTSVQRDSQITKTKSQMPVPVPVFCRPMPDVDTKMKVWCATAMPISISSPVQRESEQTGSLVWICTTSSPSGSQVTVVDANNPGSPLERFPITHAHVLCIAYVPGWSENDQCEANGKSAMDIGETIHTGETGHPTTAEERIEKEVLLRDDSCDGGIALVKCRRHRDSLDAGIATGEKNTTDLPADEKEEAVKIFQATMWLGAQNGCVYLHSGASNWKETLYAIKLPDSVLSINFVKNCVFVALANGSVGIFCRSKDGSWDLAKYYLITLGKPQHSIRCTCVVDNQFVWCGYRNKVHIVNPAKPALEKVFDVHPRKESQIRQMVWVGDGVWISIRLDSTLRLYHAMTHQHLQDVDIEPYVSKMLGTGRLGFSFVRITSLMAACNRLWIGTGNGVVICVPLSSENNKIPIPAAIPGRPGGGVFRAYRESPTEVKDMPPGSGYIPYCSLAQAQLSFHGHRDAVKFFVVLPVGGNRQSSDTLADNAADGKSFDSNANEMMLVMSGGEGYIDFRVGATNNGDTDEENEDEKKEAKSDSGQSKTYLSHLIIWQVFQNS